MLNRFSLAFAATLFALVSFADAQTTNPLKTVNSHPGGQCQLSVIPQFDLLDGTYWACRGTFTGNPSQWNIGTWTQVTPPTGLVAGDGKQGFQAPTTAQLAASVAQSTGSIAMTLTNLQSLNSVPFLILPAVPGAMYNMGPCTLNLTYGSAAFSGGGTVSIGYGTSSSPATNATIASTVFTTFTASHAVTVIPASVAVTATTSLANTGIYITAASANFTSGTGATGQLSCQYSLVTGVS